MNKIEQNPSAGRNLRWPSSPIAWPLQIWPKVKAFYQLCCCPLDAFKDLHIILKLRGPELPTVLRVRPRQCWIQWDNHFLWPPGYTVFHVPRDAVCPLGWCSQVPSHPCLVLLPLRATHLPSYIYFQHCSSPGFVTLTYIIVFST